jgi:hypothetical protein
MAWKSRFALQTGVEVSQMFCYVCNGTGFQRHSVLVIVATGKLASFQNFFPDGKKS